MGRIGDYIKQTQLKTAWENKKEGLFAQPKKDSFVSSFIKQNDEMQKTVKLTQIDSKLKSGHKLSGAEMDYLRENAPELYRQALKLEKEREEYRRALENCKTKEEAQQLHITRMAATMSAIKEASKAKGGDAVLVLQMQLMMMVNEFNEFVQSEEYAEMPSVFDADEEEKDERSEKIKVESGDDELPLQTDESGQQVFDSIGSSPENAKRGSPKSDSPKPDNHKSDSPKPGNHKSGTVKADNVGFKKSESVRVSESRVTGGEFKNAV
jgi:hypothetical protein